MRKQFKLEPHAHTAETSRCGHIPGAEVAKRCHSLGYNSIIITDHLYEEYISKFPFKDNWDAVMDRFLSGYKAAKEQGAEIGLNVLLGAEIRFGINDNDYLLFGIDEEFLRLNPYLNRLDPWEFFNKYGNDILIIQAHPFRNGNENVYPECIHGVEVFNGNPRHNNFNDKALQLCESNPQLYRLYGSDVHRDSDFGRAWMLFDEPISDSRTFHAAVKQKAYSWGTPAGGIEP